MTKQKNAKKINNMKKRLIASILAMGLVFVCGCAAVENPYASWIPENRENIEKIIDGSLRSYEEAITKQSYAERTFSGEEMTEALFAGDSDKLADELWQNQIKNGIYAITEEDILQNDLVFYISSSEGDDTNLGISPDKPRKTIGRLSGQSNITILLKCGDTFDMTKPFVAGNDCFYGTYGEGSRPVLNYYVSVDLEFTKLPWYSNVWIANLAGISEIYTGESGKDNCNVGQLLINGETNWKRVVVSTQEYNDGFDFPSVLEARADGAWAIDWGNAYLYLYSTENPNNFDIQLSQADNGFVASGVKNTTLVGWEFRGIGAHGCTINECNNVMVKCCYFHNIGGAVQTSSGVRYGNAIQVIGNAINVTVANNYVDWVYNVCYAHQNSNVSSADENVLFRDNIGAHAFMGINTWSDANTEFAAKNILFEGNIIYAICDITDPDVGLFSLEDGSLNAYSDTKDTYASYRGGYTYNDMTAIYAMSSKERDQLKIINNTIWDTKRFFVLCPSIDNGYPFMEGNFFYEEHKSRADCFFRYTDENGMISNLSRVPISNNVEHTYVSSSNYKKASDLVYMYAQMERISSFGTEEQ